MELLLPTSREFSTRYLDSPHGPVSYIENRSQPPPLAPSLLSIHATCTNTPYREGSHAVSMFPSEDAQVGRSLIETLNIMKLTVEEENFATSSWDLCFLFERCISQKNTEAASLIHALLISCGLDSDSFLASHLIRMFACFHSLQKAIQVFNKLFDPTEFLWAAIIAAHVKLGQNEEAVELYHDMSKTSSKPNGYIFIEVLKATSNMEELEISKVLHARVIEDGLESDIYIGNALIDTYASCGSLEDACRVFSRLGTKDVVSWNTLIMAYSQYGYVKEALCLFTQLMIEKITPNHITLLSILRVRSLEVEPKSRWRIHMYAILYGLETVMMVGNSLISMYLKQRSFRDACLLFERIPSRDLVTYNTLLAGCAQHQCDVFAFQLLDSMMREGLEPDCYTFVSFLKVCSRQGSLHQIMWAYSYMVKSGFEVDDYVISALVGALMKHSKLADAHVVFDLSRKDNIVVWSALIDGYAESGFTTEVFDLFKKMKFQHGLNADPVIYASVLKVCSSLCDHGKWIHAQIVEDAMESEQFVASSLIDMYCKCGNVKDACMVFERLDQHNLVVWSALIIGLTRQGQGHKALMVFEQMTREEGIELDESVYASILNACSEVAAIMKGRQIHSHIIETGFVCDAFVGSSLISMYSNCGSLDDAYRVFNLLNMQTTVTWNAVISASARHNEYSLADRLFKDMIQLGLQPNEITFLCVLLACSRAGLVEGGCHYLTMMNTSFGISPTLEHMNSMVDILSHGEKLEEAEDLLESIPFSSNIVGWMSLLSSCRRHARLNLGRRCFDYVVAMDPAKASGYLLMSNIYARSGMVEYANKINELRLFANGWKKPGKAFIEVDNDVHDFSVGERDHPRSNEIHEKLAGLTVQLKEEGYKPFVDIVLDPLPDEEKEDVLYGHCEKLAIAFGLISTPEGATIRIVKNLRMCVDCHSATKAISKIELREIIIADTHCVHKFHNGTCSCNDYD